MLPSNFPENQNPTSKEGRNLIIETDLCVFWSPSKRRMFLTLQKWADIFAYDVGVEK